MGKWTIAETHVLMCPDCNRDANVLFCSKGRYKYAMTLPFVIPAKAGIFFSSCIYQEDKSNNKLKWECHFQPGFDIHDLSVSRSGKDPGLRRDDKGESQKHIRIPTAIGTHQHIRIPIAIGAH